MNNRTLTAPVAQFGVISLVYQVKHDRTRTEIERYTVAHMQARMASKSQFSQSALLDTVHTDGGTWWRAANDLRVAPEPIVSNDRGQSVHMDDMVYLRFRGYRHGHCATSPTSSASSETASRSSATSSPASVRASAPSSGSGSSASSGRRAAASRTSSFPVTTSAIKRVRYSRRRSISRCAEALARLRSADAFLTQAIIVSCSETGGTAT